jgi:hypothetical protein
MNSRHFSGKSFVVASVVLTMTILIACAQTKQPAPAQTATSPMATTEKVFIEFQGPWAFAPDPKDPAKIVAIAPKANGHRDLYVKASNQSTLVPGVYDLSLPDHTGSGAGTADPDIARAKIDVASLQHALDMKSARYVIRIAKPEQYLVAARSKSRVGGTYPPDASTEKDYANAVSLQYNASSLNGFSLAGTPEGGAFNPLLLRVETGTVRFVIEPAQDDDPNDKCDTHSRESFRDLTTLLGLTMYVDFPDNPADCHAKDPQGARPAKKAQNGAGSGEALRSGGAGLTGSLATAVFFFGKPGGDCKSPNLLLYTGP